MNRIYVFAIWALVIITLVAIVRFANEILNTSELLLNRIAGRYISHRRFRAGQKWRSDRKLLQEVKAMHPTEFEHYIADMFSRLGYKTSTVGGPSDGGIDVIAEKDGVKNYIQCKKFITQQVTVGAMRDFYGAIADKLAGGGQGYFITTNIFTLGAKQFAEDKPIELVDGSKLIRYIWLANKDNEVTSETKNEKVETENCPKCGGKLIVKSGKFGKFLGCSNYPKCDYTRAI